MIKRLRHQFIFSNMTLVIIVMAVMFSALVLITYSYERSQTIDALEMAISDKSVVMNFFPGDQDTEFDIEDWAENGPVNGTIRTPNNVSQEKLSSIFLIARCDSSGNVIMSETSVNSNFTDEEIKTILDFASKCKDNSSIVPKYCVRFLKVETPQGYDIAFADRTTELATFSFMFRVYTFITLLILAIMFLISDYMARKAITPVEKSWNEQSRFIADASHELKTPLTVILANMDIMQSAPESTVSDQNKWIENTKSEAKRMTDLVNQMLFLARSDAQVDQNYNFQEVNISNLAEDCVLTFESVAFERGINLQSTIPMDIYTVADEARIKQVIMILLDNALKYVDDKGNIVVATSTNAKQVKLTVANTGPEIPYEKQEHLFERFYRVDESRVREKGGYGLGLSIAQNIMEAHGGSIGLEYSNENGTCFAITLPVKQNVNQKKLKA